MEILFCLLTKMSGMVKKMFYCSVQTLRSAFFRLGYSEVLNNNFKRNYKYHFILKQVSPTKVYVDGHIDYPRRSWERFKHKGIENDTRLDDELKRLNQTVKVLQRSDMKC